MRLHFAPSICVAGAVGLFSLQRPADAIARRTTRAGEHTAVRTPQPIGTGVSLGAPAGIAADAAGILFVTDTASRAVLKIEPFAGARTIVSDGVHGSGPSLPATAGSGMLALEAADSAVVAVPSHTLVRVNVVTGERTLLSGNDQRGSGQRFGFIGGIAREGGGAIVVADSSLRAVVRVDAVTGDRSVLAGCADFSCSRIVGSGPPFGGGEPSAIAAGAAGELFVGAADRLMQVDPSTGNRVVVSDNSTGDGPSLLSAKALAVDVTGDIVWLHSQLSPSFPATAVFRIDAATGNRHVLSSDSVGTGPPFRSAEALAVEPEGSVVVTDAASGALIRVNSITGDRTFLSGGPIGTGPPLACPVGLAIEPTGTLVLPAACPAGIIRVDTNTGDRAIVSDASTGSGPPFDSPTDIAVEASGALLVTDYMTVKRVDPSTGARTTLSDRSRLRHPVSVAVEAGGTALVGDHGREQPVIGMASVYLFSGLSRLDLRTGRSSVVSGGGLLSRRRGSGPGFLLGGIGRIWIEPAGSVLAVNYGTGLVHVDPTSGHRTLAGSLYDGFAGFDLAGAAVAFDRTGNLVRLDPSGDRVILSGYSRGSGPLTHGYLVPEATGALLVAGSIGVVRIDVSTGDRTVVSRY